MSLVTKLKQLFERPLNETNINGGSLSSLDSNRRKSNPNLRSKSQFFVNHLNDPRMNDPDDDQMRRKSSSIECLPVYEEVTESGRLRLRRAAMTKDPTNERVDHCIRVSMARHIFDNDSSNADVSSLWPKYPQSLARASVPVLSMNKTKPLDDSVSASKQPQKDQYMGRRSAVTNETQVISHKPLDKGRSSQFFVNLTGPENDNKHTMEAQDRQSQGRRSALVVLHEAPSDPLKASGRSRFFVDLTEQSSTSISSRKPSDDGRLNLRDRPNNFTDQSSVRRSGEIDLPQTRSNPVETSSFTVNLTLPDISTIPSSEDDDSELRSSENTSATLTEDDEAEESSVSETSLSSPVVPPVVVAGNTFALLKAPSNTRSSCPTVHCVFNSANPDDKPDINGTSVSPGETPASPKPTDTPGRKQSAGFERIDEDEASSGKFNVTGVIRYSLRRKSSRHKKNAPRTTGSLASIVPTEDFSKEDVVLRLKTEENKFEQRMNYRSVFNDVPLYQHYNRHIGRNESLIHAAENSVISGVTLAEEEDTDIPDVSQSKPPVKLDTVEQRESFMIREFLGTGPNRAKWSEIANAKLVEALTPKQRKQQEALFEIITSEASYYRSLTVLISQFYKAADFDCSSASGSVISVLDKHHLFSNILEIHGTSQNFLTDLELHWCQDQMLHQVCRILFEHAENKFASYVVYLKNQPFQTQTLERLMQSPQFLEVLRNIQKDSECGLLDLNSFLLLPMQRITRLRLLVRTVLEYVEPEAPLYDEALVAMASLEKVLKDCDAQKLHMEQKERIMQICANSEFRPHVKTVSTGDRTLVKEGELKVVDIAKGASTAFRRKMMRSRLPVCSLFLFNNVLLVAKKKTNSARYLVEDACLRDFLEVVSTDALPASAIPITVKGSIVSKQANGDETLSNQLSATSLSTTNSPITSSPTHRSQSHPSDSTNHNQHSVPGDGRFTFRLTLNKGAKGKAIYVLEAKSLSERERWMDALVPNFRCGDRKDMENWDWMQVAVTKPYNSKEPDEMDLKEGDMINVLIRLSDGWSKGVLPGGNSGWFPAKNTTEVKSEEARKKNMEKFYLGEKANKAYEEQKKQKLRQSENSLDDIS